MTKRNTGGNNHLVPLLRKLILYHKRANFLEDLVDCRKLADLYRVATKRERNLLNDVTLWAHHHDRLLGAIARKHTRRETRLRESNDCLCAYGRGGSNGSKRHRIHHILVIAVSSILSREHIAVKCLAMRVVLLYHARNFCHHGNRLSRKLSER